MGGRLQDWVKRYLPLELAATACALLGGYAAAAWSGNAAVIAYAATWTENLGFYALAIGREWQRYGALRPALQTVMVEFGPAEVLDSFVVRPTCMYVGPLLTGQLASGLILGKVAADVIFYGLAGLTYERQKARAARAKDNPNDGTTSRDES
jgi:hypothetical protein